MNSRNSLALYLRLLSFVKPYKFLFAGAILSMIILALIEASIPALLKPALDGTFVEKDPTYKTLVPLGILILFFSRGLANFTSNVSFSIISAKLVRDMRNEMFNTLVYIPSSYFNKKELGTIVSKFTYNTSQVAAASTQALTIAIKDSLTIVGLIGYLIWLEPFLSTLLLTLVPTVYITVRKAGSRLRILNRSLQDSMGKMNSHLNSVIYGNKIVRLHGTQEKESSNLKKLAESVKSIQVKTSITSNIGVPIVELFGALILAGVMFIGVSRIDHEIMTVGSFVSFFAALGLLFSPLKRITKINDPLQRALAACEVIFDFLDTPYEKTEVSNHKSTNNYSIRFEHVSFGYEQGKNVLENISLNIKQGESVALVGPSGAGKSTIVDLILGFSLPTEGEIFIGSLPVTNNTSQNVRSLISLVTQQPIIFNTSIYENITYGSTPKLTHKDHHQDFLNIAKLAHVDEFVGNDFDAYAKQLDEFGNNLSGGQKQRIALARAFYKNAPILILDEATSALDNASEKLIQDALDNIKQDTTMIVIAHRLSTIENVDRIIYMDKGKILEEGSHQELISLRKEYYAMYNRVFSSDSTKEI